MTRHEYQLLDVFTDRPFGGNQLAVFTDASDIDPTLMPRIAKELQLAETTFVLPPEKGGDHRVRIFTPARELPFAGHPTIGTGFALAGGADTALTLELGIGPIEVTVAGGFTRMSQPVPEFGDVFEDVRAMADALSLDPSDIDTGAPMQIVSSGVPFRLVRLRTLAAVRRLLPRLGPLTDHLYVFTTETIDPAATLHGRMFAPSLGIAEDAATGGAQGPLGAYCIRYGVLPRGAPTRITCEQGHEIGRPSTLYAEIDHEGDEVRAVRVGGHCVAMGGGYVRL